MIKIRSERRKAYHLETVVVGKSIIIPPDVKTQTHARITVSEWNRVGGLQGDDRLRTRKLPDGSMEIFVQADAPKVPLPTKEQFLSYLRIMGKGQSFTLGPEYADRFAEFKGYCQEFSEADQCKIVATEDNPGSLLILREA